MNAAFLSEGEAALGARFLEQGHLIVPIEDRAALDRLQGEVAALAARHLGVDPPADPGAFLDHVHERLAVAGLNDLRLAVIVGIERLSWAREAYFRFARATLETLVGNELAMQRRLNLSVQLPGDDSSLLPVHSDVWNGDSPFEVVVWLPLVDCFRTKSMFLLPPAANSRACASMATLEDEGADALFHAIEPEIVWLEVPYGHVLVFAQSLMHGNRVNREATTRWSMNCRFKSLLAPYADKRLGEFFSPITMRAATRIGLDYRLPGGFGEARP